MADEQPAGAIAISLPTGLLVLPAVVLACAVGVGGVPTCNQISLSVGVVVNGDRLGETDHHTPMAPT